MLKMVIESWKLENISHGEFIDHLTHVHGPLVARHGPALGFCEYYQNQRVESAEVEAFSLRQGWPPAPNSMNELWVEDEISMKAAFESAGAEEASAILYEDEKTFVDHKLISAYLATEAIVLNVMPAFARGGTDGEVVKTVCQLWKAPSIDKEAFLDHWQGRHASLVREHAEPLGILRYVQNLPVFSPETDSFSEGRGFRKAPDGVAEIWWKNRASLAEALSSEKPHLSSLALLENMRTFLDPSKATLFMAREHLVYNKIGASA